MNKVRACLPFIARKRKEASYVPKKAVLWRLQGSEALRVGCWEAVRGQAAMSLDRGALAPVHSAAAAHQHHLSLRHRARRPHDTDRCVSPALASRTISLPDARPSTRHGSCFAKLEPHSEYFETRVTFFQARAASSRPPEAPSSESQNVSKTTRRPHGYFCPRGSQRRRLHHLRVADHDLTFRRSDREAIWKEGSVRAARAHFSRDAFREAELAPTSRGTLPASLRSEALFRGNCRSTADQRFLGFFEHHATSAKVTHACGRQGSTLCSSIRIIFCSASDVSEG